MSTAGDMREATQLARTLVAPGGRRAALAGGPSFNAVRELRGTRRRLRRVSLARVTNQTATYLANPEDVHRVLLLYSGGLDTSVMLKWIQDQYHAEVVALTVNLGQPGEDYDVVKGKATAAGRARRVRRRRARGVRPRIHRAGDQGQRDLRPRLPAVHRARPAADRQARGRVRAQIGLRHDRPRLHRQGQRPGADRVDDRDAGARAQGDRARALAGRWGATRRSPTRANMGSRSRAGARSRPTRSMTTSGAARARVAGSRTWRPRPRTTSSSWSPARSWRPTSPRRSRSSSRPVSRSR